MATSSKDLRWVRTRGNKQFEFQYQPGSGLKTRGVTEKWFSLTSEWTRMSVDAAKVALGRFGPKIEVARTRTGK